MTLSAPGEPPVKTPPVLKPPRQHQFMLDMIKSNSLQRELFIRASNREVEAFVVVVFVRIIIAAVGTAGLVIAVASIDSGTDLRGAVGGAATGGCLLAGLEVGGKSNRGGCEQHGSGEDGLEEHFVYLLKVCM
jgi:hypothetical protein